MSKLIVGCGYLGQRVARRWLDAGQRVLATTRGRADELRVLGVEPVVCDLARGDGLESLPSVDTVLYSIGFDRGAGQTMHEVYVKGLSHVLDRLPPPRRFVYVSSTSVYGQTNGEEVDESSPTEPEESSGQVVLEAERLLTERVPGAILLRSAGIYGPGRLLRQQAIERGEPIIADPERWLNLIHVEDGAAAVLAADERGAPGMAYIVSDGEPVRRGEFYAELARLLGAPPARFVAPDPANPPPHERANRRLVNRRLREELGVTPRYQYKEGLRASVGTH